MDKIQIANLLNLLLSANRMRTFSYFFASRKLLKIGNVPKPQRMTGKIRAMGKARKLKTKDLAGLNIENAIGEKIDRGPF